MELLKVVKRQSFLSSLVYNALNVGLAIALLVTVQVSGAAWPAFILVVLSKWRVLAVRPRYWLANIQANLVDVVVSLSFVIFLVAANTEAGLGVQLVITGLYTAWLLALKPRSQRRFVVIQAGVSAFVGVTALYMVAFAWPVVAVVVLMWLIGYAVARHVLGAYEETHISFLSLIWGFVFAELGWLAYHWTVAYELPGLAGLQIPQIALIVLAISFAAERLYSSYKKHQEIRMGEVALPLLLSVSVVGVLLLGFNQVGFGI